MQIQFLLSDNKKYFCVNESLLHLAAFEVKELRTVALPPVDATAGFGIFGCFFTVGLGIQSTA